MDRSKLFIFIIIILNLLPLYGVLYWDWISFDLIYLYWLENLIIGLFVVLKFIVRPYNHPIDFIVPVFLTPFFIIHYGMFCYGHGTFIISLYGKGIVDKSAFSGVYDSIIPIIANRHLIWPFIALFIYQAIDWIRDTYLRGLGSDSIHNLMIAPYRRIIVLHITIIASGFALAALDEPVSGLIILIILKITFDIYHWLKDEKNALQDKPFILNDAMKRKIDALIESPSVKVNGKTIKFNSFEELKASKYYTMMKSILRLMGGNQHLRTMEEYIATQLDNPEKS